MSFKHDSERRQRVSITRPPSRVLQCIIVRLTEESLLPLRLACKSLKSAVLDRFATVYLEERDFCLLTQARWTLLHNLASSRLAGRLRKMVLTAQVLENVQTRNLPTVSSGTGHHDFVLALYAAARANREEATHEPVPALELMVRVWRDVRRNAPDARVILNLNCGSGFDLPDERAHQHAGFENVVGAVSDFELPLGALRLGSLAATVFARLANQAKERCVLAPSSVSGLRAFVPRPHRSHLIRGKRTTRRSSSRRRKHPEIHRRASQSCASLRPHLCQKFDERPPEVVQHR